MVQKLPYFIIEGGRPGYVVLDMLKNEEYAKLHKAQLDGKLPKPPNATVVPRAALHQRPDMLIETYPDPETGVEVKKFRDEVVVAQADERGRIFIDKDNPDLARRILREIRTLDPTIKLDPMGYLLPEEEEDGSPKPRNLGGRPRKAQHS